MMLLTLILSIVLMLHVVETVTPQNQKQLDSKAIPCNINNNLYAGPNKKVEDMIIEMNRKLDDIQNKLRNLTQKENSGKG